MPGAMQVCKILLYTLRHIAKKILGRWSEIFGKLSKMWLLVCLYNRQNNAFHGFHKAL